MAPNVRVSLDDRRPAAPVMTHATTETLMHVQTGGALDDCFHSCLHQWWRTQRRRLKDRGWPTC